MAYAVLYQASIPVQGTLGTLMGEIPVPEFIRRLSENCSLRQMAEEAAAVWPPAMGLP